MRTGEGHAETRTSVQIYLISANANSIVHRTSWLKEKLVIRIPHYKRFNKAADQLANIAVDTRESRQITRPTQTCMEGHFPGVLNDGRMAQTPTPTRLK